MSEKEKEINETAESLGLSQSPAEDLTEYIKEQSLSALMSRFGTVDEDEDIRNEDFNPLVIDGRTGQKRKSSDSRISAFKNEPVIGDGNTIKSPFGEAQSDHDSDAVAFEDIKIDAFEEPSESQDIDLNQGFDTHTRVIYFDDEIDDGIRRNTDFDVSDVFSDK